jgi:hypothetical protein
MEIRIDQIDFQTDVLIVVATFTEGGRSVTKNTQFTNADKATVERWMQDQALSIIRSMKTATEFATLEKEYVFEEGKPLTAKSAYRG